MTEKDLLKHHGVKGMKWGIRRYQPYPKGSGKKGKFLGRRQNGNKKDRKPGIKARVKSTAREIKWQKAVMNMNKMTTKEINETSNRIRLENDYKRLSKKRGIGSKKDRNDYLKRENMSNQELSRKVNRLRAKEGLTRNVNTATKSQREIGKKIAYVATGVGVQYALSKTVSFGDLFAMATNPNQAKDKAAKAVLDHMVKRKK